MIHDDSTSTRQYTVLPLKYYASALLVGSTREKNVV